jgi:F0F1-type ATP synthase membrane subunit b/b'
MTIWFIVGAIIGLVLLYFVIKYAVLSALHTIDEERYERATRRERAARRDGGT